MKRLLTAAAIVLAAPAGIWGLGGGLASLTPASYRSTAVVRLADADEGGARREERRLKSPEVLGAAMQQLRQGSGAGASISGYLLWSSLETESCDGNTLRLAMRGPDAAGAQRRLEAVINAYRTAVGTAAVAAMDAGTASMAPVRAGGETRMVLGVAAAALIALAGSIPLLKKMEAMEFAGRPA